MPGSSLAARRRNSPRLAAGQHGEPAQKPAAEGRSPPRGLQGEPLPRRHPAGGPSWRAERRDEREAVHAAAEPGRARRGERPARRDAQQRRRPGHHRVQDQCRILSPVCEPAQRAGVGPADAGTVRRHQPQSQLARRRPEQVRRQPRIGQPVAEKNRPAALPPATSTAITLPSPRLTSIPHSLASGPGRSQPAARPRTASGRGSTRTQPALPQSSGRRATPGQQSRNVTYIAGRSGPGHGPFRYVVRWPGSRAAS